MHRHLTKVVRRSITHSRNASKDQNRVRRNASENIQWFQTFSTSQDCQYFNWKPQLGTQYAQLQIVNSLRLGERERAFKMLLNLGDSNRILGPDDFTFVLDYCAQTPDPLFVMETWRIMEEKAVTINTRCCQSIVQAFSKGGYLKEAFSWLTFVGEHDFGNSMLPLYNIFLRECGGKQSFSDADRCVELMDCQHVGKSEITYWELLKFAVLQEDLSAVYEIWKDCTMYYSPSIVTMRKFIWSFTRLNALEPAYSVLQYMIAQAFQENTSLRQSSARRYQSLRLDIPIPSYIKPPHSIFCSSCKESREDINEMKFETIEGQEMETGVVKAKLSLPVNIILRWSFNNVIHACARAKNCQLAEQLFMQMCDLGIKPSGDTYDGFVKAVVCDKGVTYGMKVIKSMEKRNIKPYNDTLATLSTGHSKILELDLAEDLLEKISDVPPKYIHSFNALLAACDIMDQPDRAIRILAKMKHLKIKLNIRTYELIYSLFGNVNIPYEKGNMLSHADVIKRIYVIEKDMIRSGVEHSYSSMKNLMRSLGAEGMIHDMLRYLCRAESMFWNLDPCKKSDMYNVVLHALVVAKESSHAIELFRNMRQCGYPANVATYNVMLECCSMLPCFKSASAILSIMLRDGFVPQTLTYNALLKVVLAYDDFDKAVTLLDHASSDGIQFDIQLFNTILKQALYKGQLDIIEHIVELVNIKKIRPDPSTCWYTFSAYVESGFHTTAMEALQVMSLRMISADDKILQEHKNTYEDLIYSEESDVESMIVEIFKESQEFIATALLSLRWCAINGLHVSWCPNESLWAKRLSSSYEARRKAVRIPSSQNS